ncbi:RNA polymerase sigma factor [Psychroflexus aestuariivivens]|uniref:RNA polymerase sigma factor n=1 Tax=Psychroflexus aestuariivivens TaxID=1795040 RepID=UPI000FDCD5E0|nr:sigma-70 family RNA polymerase sigma factor [Psychroflexus aestuariivivens]
MQKDKNLIDKVCLKSIFERIYQQQSTELYRHFYYKFGHSVWAEEVVQEAFIKLWEKCKDVPFLKARSFLFTVANNLSLNRYKHQKVVLNYQKSHTQSKEDHQTPEFVLEEEEFKVKLQNAIQQLTPKQRSVFLLHRVEGKSYKEIAEMEQISVKAVEKRMQNALILLRKEIEQLN